MWNLLLRFTETDGRLAAETSFMRGGSTYKMGSVQDDETCKTTFYDDFAVGVQDFLRRMGLKLTFNEIRGAFGDDPMGDALATVLRGSKVRFMKERGVVDNVQGSYMMLDPNGRCVK